MAYKTPLSDTVYSVSPKDYWRVICAPQLRARKKDLGRSVPEKAIAAYVEAESGLNTGRSLVNGWLLGTHQPYIGQFIALCNKMGVDPFGILRGELLVVSTSSSTRRFIPLSTNAQISLGKTGHGAKAKRKERSTR